MCTHLAVARVVLSCAGLLTGSARKTSCLPAARAARILSFTAAVTISLVGLSSSLMASLVYGRGMLKRSFCPSSSRSLPAAEYHTLGTGLSLKYTTLCNLYGSLLPSRIGKQAQCYCRCSESRVNLLLYLPVAHLLACSQSWVTTVSTLTAHTWHAHVAHPLQQVIRCMLRFAALFQ